MDHCKSFIHLLSQSLRFSVIVLVNVIMLLPSAGGGRMVA